MEREGFSNLDAAMAALEEWVREIRRKGPLDEFAGFRDYEPGERVHARLELSTGGPLRGREAGLDLMGDGALVPYRGTVRKQRLEPGPGRSPFDAVREAIGE